jgi:photosystem II stability/assembly factor-like uncharacterized protein
MKHLMPYPLSAMQKCKHLNRPIEHISRLAILFYLILLMTAPNIYGVNKSSSCGGPGGGDVHAIAIDPQNASVIYAVASSRLYKSTNSGDNWSAVTGGLASASISVLAFNPQNSATIYAGGYSGLFGSTDGGMHWIASGLAKPIEALVINPLNPAIVYALSYDGVFKSTNGGMSWIVANNGISNKIAQKLVIDPKNTEILYAGTRLGGVYKSTNGGASWSAINNGLPNNMDDTIDALAIDPKAPATLYVKVYNHGLYKSTNGGASWNASGLTNIAGIDVLAIDPQNPTILYAGGGGVYQSTNSGTSWANLAGPLLACTALAIDPAEPWRIYAGGYYGGVWTYVAGRSSLDITMSSSGAASANTIGSDEATLAGYASIAVNSGAVPYGTAVFSYKHNGITVTEAGVPVVPPTKRARVFIDYRAKVDAIPGRSDSGKIDINTGIAVVNYSDQTAIVTYILHAINGPPITIGSGTIAAKTHIGKFINQLNEVASGFQLPANFQTAIQFASLEIVSNLPLSLIALRMTTNQRNEVLYTTTPIADLTAAINANPIYFPQFADGGGFTTSLILLNSSYIAETGTLEFFDNDGVPLVVSQAGGMAGSSFKYSIPGYGAIRFQTDGFSAEGRNGWVRLTPDAGSSTPVGSGVFGYNPESILVSESGFPATVSTTHAQIYVDLSRKHNTGLAVANVESNTAAITIKAFQKDGVTLAGTNSASFQLAGNGHTGQFVNQLIQDLPAGFTGVLDISSITPFAALTLRSLHNERDDFLMTTFPVADANQAAHTPVVFPHIADGIGYATEFILLSPYGAANASLQLFSESGAPMDIGQW